MMFESEERRITERIKDYIKNERNITHVYIMLRNGQILKTNIYRGMIDSGKINPQDAYVYIKLDHVSSMSAFYYPFLDHYGDLLSAYLSKLGFHDRLTVVPATGLKYMAFAEVYGDYLSVEVTDLLAVVNNTNLPKIAVEVLDGKLISGEKELTQEEYIKILNTFKSQRLFAGHNLGEARNIIHDYYDKLGQSLAMKVARITEVARVAMDYDRIFHPYRVCYETKNWKEIDCRLVR